ncbi:MAG: Fur family transcriptional regulator [Spirochaetia bacterium]|jgi:Fur family ferric uptake transcriptional regulator
MDIEQKITTAFREFSERSTQPRQVIARSLIRLGKSGAVFSAEDLIKRLHKSNPGIGRATVYRSMEKLVGLKVLERIDFSDGTHYFRLCKSDGHHHHLACTNCHRVLDLDFCLNKDQIAAIERQQSFSIRDHSITLFGLCKDCQAE